MPGPERTTTVGRRTLIGGACVVATTGFTWPHPARAVEQLTAFDLPLVLDLVAVGDTVSLRSSAHGQYVVWQGRVLGCLPGDRAAPSHGHARIAQCEKMAERSYRLEIHLVR